MNLLVFNSFLTFVYVKMLFLIPIQNVYTSKGIFLPITSVNFIHYTFRPRVQSPARVVDWYARINLRLSHIRLKYGGLGVGMKIAFNSHFPAYKSRLVYTAGTAARGGGGRNGEPLLHCRY